MLEPANQIGEVARLVRDLAGVRSLDWPLAAPERKAAAAQEPEKPEERFCETCGEMLWPSIDEEYTEDGGITEVVHECYNRKCPLHLRVQAGVLDPPKAVGARP